MPSVLMSGGTEESFASWNSRRICWPLSVPANTTVKELMARIAEGGVREVIMATDSDTEGETTAMYLSRLMKPFGIKVTRLAYGIPVGSDLQYADEITLSRAIAGRRDM